MTLRRDSGRPPLEMKWNGRRERAAEIDTWARNAALLPRWQWHPGDEFARVLVEREYPHSAEWVAAPAGSVIRRQPPPEGVKLEEADWPLRVEVPEILIDPPV